MNAHTYRLPVARQLHHSSLIGARRILFSGGIIAWYNLYDSMLVAEVHPMFTAHHELTNRRPTLAFLSENANHESESLMLAGAVEAAERCDVNLLYFTHLENDEVMTPTSELSDTKARQRKLEQLTEQFDVDGVLFIGWSKKFNPEHLAELRQRLHHVPFMSIGKDFESIPSVLMDGGFYVEKITRHLINEHDCREIAFIAPWNNDARVISYDRVLEEFGIADERRIVRHESMTGWSIDTRMRKALSLLLDDRQVAVDAILVMTALDGQYMRDAILERGLRIPEDIALVCYENEPSLTFSKPSLTTIHYPFRELGYTGVETLVQLVRTGECPFITDVPGAILYRDSCGCTVNNVKPMRLDRPASFSKFASLEDAALTVGDTLRSLFPSIPLDYAGLVELFVGDVRGVRSGRFLDSLQKQILYLSDPIPAAGLAEMIDAFREQTIRYTSDDEAMILRAEELLFAARYVTKDRDNYDNILLHIDQMKKRGILDFIGKSLLSTYSIPSIMNTLESYMGWIQIPTNYLVTYNDKDNSFDSCRAIFAYHDHENRLRELGRDTSIRDIFGTFNRIRNRRFALIVMLMHVGEDHIGVSWMETGQCPGDIILTLGIQISTALKGSLLISESQSLVQQLSSEIELRKEKELQLAHYANSDALTRLYNRRFFYDTLNAETRGTAPFSLFFIDIDGFKKVNDTYGHDIGDALLVQISERIIANLGRHVLPVRHAALRDDRHTKAIFRHGGDEFIALIAGARQEQVAGHAQRLVASISEPYFLMNHTVNVSCSIGISRFPEQTRDPLQLVKLADIAMYRAKETGDGFEFY